LLEVLKQAVESVLTLFLMGLTGFWLHRRGWITQDICDFIPKLVVKCSLPLYLFSTALKVLTRGELRALAVGTATASLSCAATLALALLTARLFKIQAGRRGIFCVAFAFSNTMFLGLPINLALFGESAVLSTIAYFLANSLLFWTFGNWLLSLDVPGQNFALLSRETLARLLPPPLLGFAAGVLCVSFDAPVPAFIRNFATYLGAITTPMALMYIGMGLSAINWRTFRFERDLALVTAGRFVVCPLMTGLLAAACGVGGLMAQVFIIQSSLPTLAACSIMAGYYRSDSNYAVLIVSLTTLMAIVTVPVFRIVVTLL
jgi:predicted permease